MLAILGVRIEIARHYILGNQRDLAEYNHISVNV
jgi:hypothetical protein